LTFCDFILDNNTDTLAVNEYIANLNDNVDDITKAMVCASASIYNNSSRLWDNPLLKKIFKPTVSILAADAIGGALSSGALYGLDVLITEDKWSWGHFAVGVMGYAAFTSLGIKFSP